MGIGLKLGRTETTLEDPTNTAHYASREKSRPLFSTRDERSEPAKSRAPVSLASPPAGGGSCRDSPQLRCGRSFRVSRARKPSINLRRHMKSMRFVCQPKHSLGIQLAFTQPFRIRSRCGHTPILLETASLCCSAVPPIRINLRCKSRRHPSCDSKKCRTLRKCPHSVRTRFTCKTVQTSSGGVRCRRFCGRRPAAPHGCPPARIPCAPGARRDPSCGPRPTASGWRASQA